jgi:hypothetical protein
MGLYGTTIAIATIICGAIMFFSGLYISFLNVEQGTTIQLADIDSKLEPCIKAVPGVCERNCAFSVEQMGIKWGSLIPMKDKDCRPNPSECCCELNQMDLQKVRSCRKISACRAFNQGVQYQKCLAPNEMPLVAGNHSGDVCGVKPDIFCGMQAKLGPAMNSVSSKVKNFVAYPIMFASALIIFSGVAKLQQQVTSKSGNCCGWDTHDWGNIGNVCGTCSICFAFTAFCIAAVGYSILLQANNASIDLCAGKKWNDASTQCVSQCKTSISDIMNHYACPVAANIQSLRIAMNIMSFGTLLATVCICLGYCVHIRKRSPKKLYVPMHQGRTVSPPGEVSRSGGNNMQYMPPVVAVAQPQMVAQPQAVANPPIATAKQ